ncbi:helix-turn-helix domain-containing protein [Frankia sp. AvcI1]|uniref:winged helix-turn-helix transcriptional regulator n=1 Tax=Frankia sp. AvcI1 TaxID=573496 RepID=UPI000ADC0EC7|nr:helix-turn-helix domain-containing protein [Frankia sp. AvcI1]
MAMKPARSARARAAGPGRAGGPAPAEVPGGVPPALAALVDLLGRRFALGLYWHLRGGSLPFRTLAARLDAPEAQLVQRLRELREAGLVEVDEVGEYRLTPTVGACRACSSPWPPGRRTGRRSARASAARAAPPPAATTSPECAWADSCPDITGCLPSMNGA